MDNHNLGIVQGIGSSDIGAFADNLAESLDRQMKIAFEPEERKSLRRFSSSEVAEFLRVSTSNLRNRHKDGSFPDRQKPRLQFIWRNDMPYAAIAY